MFDRLARIREHLFRKKRAYQLVFCGDDKELHDAGKAVLADLKRFCYVDRSTMKVSPITINSDPLAMAFAEGKREVWLRITQAINLDDAQIARLIEHQINAEDHTS